MTITQFNLLLDEVRAIRTSLDEHRQEAVQRLVKLEAHLDIAVPRITTVEQSVKELAAWKVRMVGIGAGVSVVVTSLVAILFHIL